MKSFVSPYSVEETKARIAKALSDTPEWVYIVSDVRMRTLFINSEICTFELWEKLGARSGLRSFELQGSIKKQPNESTLVNVKWRPAKSFFLFLPLFLIAYVLGYIFLANSLGRIGIIIFIVFLPVFLIGKTLISRYRMLSVVKNSLR